MTIKMPKNRFSTSMSIFESRGDPWISPRDREKDWKRSEAENPDLDQYENTFDLQFAGSAAFDSTEEGRPGHDKLLRKAPHRPIYKDPPPIGKGREQSLQLRVAQIRMKFKARRKPTQDARVSKSVYIYCPFDCGVRAQSDAAMTKHLLKFPKGSCRKD